MHGPAFKFVCALLGRHVPAQTCCACTPAAHHEHRRHPVIARQATRHTTHKDKRPCGSADEAINTEGHEPIAALPKEEEWRWQNAWR